MQSNNHSLKGTCVQSVKFNKPKNDKRIENFKNSASYNNMSGILRNHQLDSACEIIWAISFLFGILVMIIILLAFIKTVQHIHCIPKSFANAEFRFKFESRHFKLYSTSSVLLATINAFITLSVFLVCSLWNCGERVLSRLVGIIWYDSYIGSRIFLYLIFIDRLASTRYILIYQCPKYIEYLLRMLLIVVIISLIAYNITLGLDLARIKSMESFDIVIVTIYGIIDCILSISLTLLFFRPIRIKNAISTSGHISVVIKYAVLSVLQLIVSVSFQLALMEKYCLYFVAASTITVRVYSDVQGVLAMLDCLLLIICIYCGFARQPTLQFSFCMEQTIALNDVPVFFQHKSCFRICSVYCEWCIFGCYTGEDLEDFYAQPAVEPVGLLQKEAVVEPKCGQPSVSSVQKVLSDTTIAISSTPDMQPLTNK